MRCFAAALVVIALAASVLVPLSYGNGHPPLSSVSDQQNSKVEYAPLVGESLDFPATMNTSDSVREYPQIARGLILPGGSTDATLADLNGDGRTDLLVAVADARMICIFYRHADGVFSSEPSQNITLPGNPIALATADAFADGHVNVFVLTRRNSDSDTEHLMVFNVTSETSYSLFKNTSLYQTASSMAIGDLDGDSYPDVAFACPGLAPSSSAGVVEILSGPDYGTFILFNAGRGAYSLAIGNFTNDGLQDIAVSNYYDSSVQLFYQPFSIGNPPATTLSVNGNAIVVARGLLNAGIRDDIVVGTDNPKTVEFFFQSESGGLPTVGFFNRSLSSVPSSIDIGDLDGDVRDDVIVLSMDESVCYGFYQLSASPTWPLAPNFTFPTGAGPRNALIGQLDSDAQTDFAIASARSDWSGSSLAIYPPRVPTFSNSNATIWANKYMTASMIASGDINGDDDIDLVFLNPSMNSFGYMLSNRTTGFSTSENARLLGFTPREMIVQDLNLDLRADILISENLNNGINLYSWNVSSPGDFNSSRLVCGGNISDVAVGDFNDDSLPDVLAATDNGTLEIFFNRGLQKPFVSTPDLVIHSAQVPNWTVAVGHYNIDGLDDIAYPLPGCKIGILLQRDAAPTIPSVPDITLFGTGTDFTSLWAGDVTGDGKDDIAAMRPADLSMYLFDQDDFTTTYNFNDTLAFPEMPMFVSVIDATDDGPVDVLAIFRSADLLFLYRQEGGVLPDIPSMTFVAGAEPNYATIGDATQDHRGDLLVHNAGSHTVSAWRQVNFNLTAYSGGPYKTRQGDPLQFNGSSRTGTSEIPYMEYNWSYGDGNWSGWVRQARPIHIYYELRSYTVNLSVRDPWGLMDTTSTTVEVLDSYPHLSFTWQPTYPKEGEVVLFNDTSKSYDPIVMYNWSVDGSLVHSSSNNAFERQFQNGTFVVTLEATDSDGSVKNLSHSIVVLPVNPVLDLDANATALEGESVRFAVAVDPWYGSPWDQITSYEWDFSYEEGNFIADQNTGTVNWTEHRFTASGYSVNYTVAVRVTDVDGGVSLANATIEVFDIGPVADFELSTADPQEGVPFSFINSSYTWDGIVSGYWQLVDSHSVSTIYPLTVAPLTLTLGDGSYTMHLFVNESDGDNSTSSLGFIVRELPPSGQLVTQTQTAEYQEYSNVTFWANIVSYDAIVDYKWDFDAIGGAFVTDRTTSSNTTTYVYAQIGDYTAKVNVTDSDGSFSYLPVYVRILQEPLVGTFDDFVQFARDPGHTNIITFNATSLAGRYHDIVETIWDFGDGASQSTAGPPSMPVTHAYSPVDDFNVHLTITDDDHYSLVLNKSIRLKAPTIGLSELPDYAVVRSGTPLNFIIGQGSTSLVSVMYSVNNGSFQNFSVFYTLDTSAWENGTFSVVVRASDQAGNVAFKSGLTIVIDNVKPVVSVISAKTTVYGGERMNITVIVVDANVASRSVVLFVKFPGDSSFSQFTMNPAGNGSYYRVFEVPARAGELQFRVNVTDMAGNYAQTSIQSANVKLHFIDMAWPYLLALAILAALGTGAYFMREVKIAVDETFVIYNDGRLISHSTRRLKPGMDDQVLSGMFVAIQDFVKDSFKDVTSFTLRKLEFGEKSVLIEKGEFLFLAVILHGKASRKVGLKMQRIVNEIEREFGIDLVDWDGDLDALRGVGDIAKRLYSKAPLLPRPLKRPDN